MFDSQYKILKISTNYKGSFADTGGLVRACAVPHQDAFFAMHQIFATPSDVKASKNSRVDPSKGHRSQASINSVQPLFNGRESPGHRNRTSISSFSSSSFAGDLISGGPNSSSRSTSALSTVADKACRKRNAGFTSYDARSLQVRADNKLMAGTYLSVESTLNNNLNSVLKVLVKPLAECSHGSTSFNRNFNDVLNDMKLYEYDYNDIILRPSTGYVIAARRPNHGQRIYLNVCHHEAVGLLSAKEKGAKLYQARLLPSGSLVDEDFPYVIGSINKLYDEQPELHNENVAAAGDEIKAKILAVTIDIVIPSSLWKFLLEEDSTGDLREQVSSIYCMFRYISLTFDSSKGFHHHPAKSGHTARRIRFQVRLTSHQRRLCVLRGHGGHG